MAFVEKMVDRKVIYNGYIIDVTLDTISIDNGDSKILSKREIVHHKGGVCALVKTKDNKIFFVKQFRYAFNKEIIELPAGKLEKDEIPLNAIIREVEEEVGVIPKKVIDMGCIYPSVGFTNEVLYLYYIDDYILSEQKFDEDEFLDLFTLSYDEAIKLIETGEICDSKTVCLLLKCKKFFE